MRRRDPEFNLIPEKNTHQETELEKMEKIKTPDELFSFMKNNIHYGFIGKDDEKVYSPQHEGWGEGEQPKQKLQKPEELLESKFGTCWEQTELEKHWFSKNNLEFRTLLFMFGKDYGQANPAHTLLAYKKDEKWYWFENSLGDNNGIHEFESLEDLVDYVRIILINSARSNGATDEDISKYALYDYDVPAYDCSTNEFITKVTENEPLKLNQE